MSTVDSNISSNEDTEMKSPPMNESSNTEPDVDETLNIETKSSPSETKKTFSKKLQLSLPQIPRRRINLLKIQTLKIQQVVQI